MTRLINIIIMTEAYISTVLRIRPRLTRWSSTGWAKKSDTSRTISKHADVDS